MRPQSTPAVVVSDRLFVEPGRVGGVQACTRDYLSLLSAAGLDVTVHAVSPTRRLGPRVRARLGLSAYDLYDTSALLPGVLSVLDRTGAPVVCLNQMSLVGLASPLRQHCPDVRVVILSHGNESGDAVHEALASGRPSMLAEWRLGRMLTCESAGLRLVDAVLCLSETEAHINRWLGLADTLVVPRTWTPDFLDLQPVVGRVGFVGTLDHPPNQIGLGRLMEELDRRGGAGITVRVVGGPPDAGRNLAARWSRIDYCGPLSPADLREEVRTWCAALNPVWWTSRGASTKLAEALAWGLPVLTTTAGARGYEWAHGHLEIADSPPEMAVRLEALACDLAASSAVAAATRDVARSGVSLTEVAERVRPLLLAPPRPR